jgi:DNA-binding MarR family transcriptional regulator
MKNIYLTFLSLADAISPPSVTPGTMDFESKKLLEVIYMNYANGTALTVTDAMQQKQVGSPATIHRRIDFLRAEGLVEIAHFGKNKRSKHLKPTQAAQKYFDEVNDALLTALNANQPPAQA